jgi:hypothetical protein
MKLLMENWRKFAKRLLSLFKKEHAECSSAEILVEILHEAGIRAREIATLGLEEMFEKWYKGKCDKKSVRASLGDFFSSHGVKLSKEIQNESHQVTT